MIEKIINASVRHHFFIVAAALLLLLGSLWSMRHTPLDALPDLSPPQVIVQVNWRGQSPDIVEAQVTYPLVAKFLAIAGIDTVRGFSTYENALIYIIFKEKTDLYWARSRVLEQLAAIQGSLPRNAWAALGPDASGVGWVYEYALVSKIQNLAQLRTLQDYTLKYALMGVEGVSDVAGVGGFVPTFQVTLSNAALVRNDLAIGDVIRVIKANNNDTGGRIVIQNGYEWMVRARGYVKNLEDIRNLVVARREGIPVTLGDLGRVELAASPRRGVADLNGQGEVVGGIVMVRYGEDAYRVIRKVKAKLRAVKPADVDIVETYDRSQLIEKALGTLKRTLIEESLIVVGVIALFLFHLRSSLIVLIVLPLTIGTTFLLMKLAGIGSNIMSLGGIAIAIGTMVDASIVMIENAHKTLEKAAKEGALDNRARTAAIVDAARKVGRPIFFALVLVIVSFLPIFALSGQEGKLFSPLAFTKTFAMAAGALLSVTLVPVLMVWLVCGRIPGESQNPLSRFFIRLYHPLLMLSLRFKHIVILGAVALLVGMVPLYRGLKWEFMPMLNEETFMYMPVTPYGISVDLSKQLTQKTDAIIKSFPEVATVFGKGGRADTATDPAPLGMLETIITFKPQSEWREGMSYEKLRRQLEAALQVPGLVNSWTYPIRGRIDMLLSGIRTPLGIKIYGDDAKILRHLGREIEAKLQTMDRTLSVFADQTDAGYYIDIDINATELARYGIAKDEILAYTSSAVGGMRVGTLIKGLERYPIAVRLEETDRRTLEALRDIQVKTPLGFVPLGQLATVRYKQSASVIKTEMSKPVTFVYITPQNGVSAKSYRQQAQTLLDTIALPSGYYMEWAGQSEYLQRAMDKIVWIVPVVLVVILALIYLALRRLVPSLIVFFTLPFALLGGLLCLEYLGFNLSIAVVVGFLALLGVAAETAIVMVIYLQESVGQAKKRYGRLEKNTLREAIYDGAVQRLRPKLMTLFSILAGLAPIMLGGGVGSEVMQRIAAPMLGGIVTSALLSLFVIPILYEIYIRRVERVRV